MRTFKHLKCVMYSMYILLQKQSILNRAAYRAYGNANFIGNASA